MASNNGSNPYVGRRVNPDLLMGLTPAEIFNLDGYSGDPKGEQKLFTNQTWLRNQECRGCGTEGYYALGAYTPEQVGLKGIRKSMLVLPCDCGTILDVYPRSD